MNVAELIRHVKALPAHEREKVFEAILAPVCESPAARLKQAKRVAWPDVEARAKRVFGDCVLPNLVLLEREANASEVPPSKRRGPGESQPAERS